MYLHGTAELIGQDLDDLENGGSPVIWINERNWVIDVTPLRTPVTSADLASDPSRRESCQNGRHRLPFETAELLRMSIRDLADGHAAAVASGKVDQYAGDFFEPSSRHRATHRAPARLVRR